MTNQNVIKLVADIKKDFSDEVNGLKDDFTSSISGLKDELHEIVVNQEKRFTALETTHKNLWYAFLFITSVLTLIVGFLALKA